MRDQSWLSQGRHKVAANEERISVDFSDEALHFYRLFLEDVRREDEGAYDCHLSTNPSLRRTIWLTVAGEEGGWMDLWGADGGLNRHVDGWETRQMDEKTIRRTERQTDGGKWQRDRKTNRWKGRQTDE